MRHGMRSGKMMVLALGAMLAGCAATAPARAPSSTEQVAERFIDLHRRGWATGEWGEYLALISDDFTFWMPAGDVRGKNVGKTAWERYVRSATQAGTRLTISAPQVLTMSGDHFVFESTSEGLLFGKVPWKNRVAISVDVRDGKIVGFREYFGDLDPEFLRMLAGPK